MHSNKSTEKGMAERKSCIKHNLRKDQPFFSACPASTLAADKMLPWSFEALSGTPHLKDRPT